MIRNSLITLGFLLSIVTVGYGQEPTVSYPSTRLSLKGDFRLPTPIANNAFRRTVDGVGEFNIALDQPLFKGVFVGVNGTFSIFQVNDFAINQRTNGQILIYSGQGKIGYQKFISERILVEGSTLAGVSYFDIISETCSLNGVEKVTFTAPTFGYQFQGLLLTGGSMENLLIGAIVGHRMIFDNYHPSLICMEKFSGYLPVDYVGPYHMYSVGFSFTVLLGQERRR